MASRKMRGFSLIELLIVITVAMIACGIIFMTIQPALYDAHVNAAYDNALTQLRMARQRAITEGKRYIVSFGAAPPPGAAAVGTAQSIQMWRWDVGVPVSPAPVLVSSVTLPADITFQTLGGLPAPAPDGMGAGAKAIDFDQGVGAGSINYVMFMPDGSAHDELGNANSGIVYMARLTNVSSTRAITVFGTTGVIRGWRITQSGGTRWTQQ
ncbi:MAG: type II secretion system protein [Acidobacteriales bacterium]|nr:type II secretion system protein [Terriglobales bacterium]